MGRRNFVVASAYDVALVLASDSEFVDHVRRISEPTTDESKTADARSERVLQAALVVYYLALAIAWTTRISPALPPRRSIGGLLLLFASAVVIRGLSEPSIKHDLESNELVVEVRVGPDDVPSKFLRAARLAKGRQSELLGYRAPSRGRARPARAAHFAYCELYREMTVTSIIEHWSTLTNRWVQQEHPAQGAPEWEAWNEWQSKGDTKVDELDETSVYSILRAWHAHHEAVERAHRVLITGVTAS